MARYSTFWQHKGQGLYVMLLAFQILITYIQGTSNGGQAPAIPILQITESGNMYLHDQWMMDRWRLLKCDGQNILGRWIDIFGWVGSVGR